MAIIEGYEIDGEFYSHKQVKWVYYCDDCEVMLEPHELDGHECEYFCVSCHHQSTAKYFELEHGDCEDE